MVNELLQVAPAFPNTFNRLTPVSKQVLITKTCFKEMKKEWDDMVQKFPHVLEASDGKKYFQTNRKFLNLVPEGYRRSAAPRLTTGGSTLHGMKKDLSKKVLKYIIKDWTQKGYNYSILDLDMSAAHARFAIAIQGTTDSELFRAVDSSKTFWDERAVYYFKRFQEVGIAIPQDKVRALLKVALYTSLNGGNPFSKERLYKSLTDNYPELTAGYGDSTEFGKSDTFLRSSEVLEDFTLIAEVKQLNERCVVPNWKRTYTLDRDDPYPVDSVHKGISRALQGYEVVMQSVLAREIIASGGLPINLAHDGIMAVFPGCADSQALSDKLTEQIRPWSTYLLNGLNLPIECKFNFNKQTLEGEFENLSEIV